MSSAVVGANRWRPQTEADIRVAALDGRLEETHWCDLKALVGTGRPANRELARDIASFAVDGGMLVIGVGEPTTPGDPLVCEPIPLDGLAESVESIARSIPDPPLPVTCRAIPSADSPAVGWLIIDVPMSGSAPHMVDGVYYGRGDKQRRRLTDREVRDLHQRLEANAEVIATILDDVQDRDPVPSAERQQAHLYVVMEPLYAPDNAALIYTDGSWLGQVRGLINSSMNIAEPGLIGVRFAPELDQATQPQRRADGVAMVNHYIQHDRSIARLHNVLVEDFLELVITYRGGLRLTVGGFSRVLSNGTYGSATVPTVVDALAPVLTRRLLHIACQIGSKIGYKGPWAAGFAANRLQSTVAASLHMEADMLKPRYDRTDYRRTTIASTEEVEQTPGQVTDKLVGSLLRSYGVRHLHAGLLGG